MFQTVLITGASSGIGRALALHYADQRCALGLLGRNAERLEAVAAECRKRGAQVRTGALDIRQRASMKTWIEEFDRASPVDLVVANAGVMEGRRPGGDIEPADAAYELIETNVLGVFNTIQPLLPAMMARGRGHIAIVSSLAGFIPLPDSPSYCASKSAVMSYGLSLRALLAARGIGVGVVCPGYIDTPMMHRESGPKPFKMTAEKAASLIDRGIERNRALIVFPVFFGLMTRLSALLPDRIRRWSSQSFRFTVSPPGR
jgi:short-subunit dehydrogenase